MMTLCQKHAVYYCKNDGEVCVPCREEARKARGDNRIEVYCDPRVPPGMIIATDGRGHVVGVIKGKPASAGEGKDNG